MPKDLAELASKIGSLQFHYVAIFLGFALALKIADRKGNDKTPTPRDDRRRVASISRLLIISGMALGAFITLIPVLVETFGG